MNTYWQILYELLFKSTIWVTVLMYTESVCNTLWPAVPLLISCILHMAGIGWIGCNLPAPWLGSFYGSGYPWCGWISGRNTESSHRSRTEQTAYCKGVGERNGYHHRTRMLFLWCGNLLIWEKTYISLCLQIVDVLFM